MKKMFKLAQVSVIEMIFAVILFASFFFYINSDSYSFSANKYSFNIDSFVDSIYYSEDFRTQVFSENLSSAFVTGNWSNFSKIADFSYINYELIISNTSTSKYIFNCGINYSGKYLTERIFTIRNNTVFEFRKMTFGVCY